MRFNEFHPDGWPFTSIEDRMRLDMKAWCRRVRDV